MIGRIKMLRICLLCGLLLSTFTLFSQIQQKNAIVKNVLGKPIDTDSLSYVVNMLMQKMNVPGLSMAIINDGKIVYHDEQGYADIGKKIKVSRNTIFEAASLSKPLFAFFVMDYVERGLLNLDTPLYQYMPYADIAHDERYKKITARMVLSHTSGFPNWRKDYQNGELFIQFDPGTSFLYSGEGYQYLAKVLMHLENTDDEGLESIYEERIAKPLQLKVTKFVQNEQNLSNKAKGYRSEKVVSLKETDVFGAAFSVHTTASDYSKWLAALMESKLLDEKSYQELFKTQVLLPEDSEQRTVGISEWTLGFSKANLPFGVGYGHGGNNSGYTCLFGIFPQTKWGFAVFTNANQSDLPFTILQYLMTP
ncbi:MAG: serine hydrolase domain-containing protein [Croceivirga sp.]